MPDAPRRHQWVQMVMAPADVVQDLEGNPMVMVDRQKWEAAEEHPVTACWGCGIDVTAGHNTNCPGAMDPFPPELTEEFPQV